MFVLGNRFSGLVAIQPGHTLVTTGIYSVIRHPSYLGLLVNSLGWALAFRSSVGLLLTALTIIPLVARMNAEEALLRSQFGAEYGNYMARTSRLSCRMKRSEHRILTTHVGSLIPARRHCSTPRATPTRAPRCASERELTHAVADVVARQARPASTSSMTASTENPAGRTTSWNG